MNALKDLFLTLSSSNLIRDQKMKKSVVINKDSWIRYKNKAVSNDGSLKKQKCF